MAGRRHNSDSDYKNTLWWETAHGLSALTPEDRARVRHGFSLFNKNKLANGARFFSNFFRNNPTYVDLFPALQGVTPDDIKNHPFILCVHVERFFVIFDDFLSNMYNTDGLRNAVYGMLNSKSHVQSHIEVIHCKNMLSALLDTIIDILKEESAWTLEMEISWKKFMGALLEVIKQEIADAETLSRRKDSH